jgi:hypothetical protein
MPPFDAYAETRIFTGDGGGLLASTRYGDWAVDRLVVESPEAILAAFNRETGRNSATYLDVSPIFGVDGDRRRRRTVGRIDRGGGNGGEPA